MYVPKFALNQEAFSKAKTTSFDWQSLLGKEKKPHIDWEMIMNINSTVNAKPSNMVVRIYILLSLQKCSLICPKIFFRSLTLGQKFPKHSKN